MFGVDKGADAALLLGLGNRVQGKRRLTRAFRPVDLDDTSARQAADAKRDVEAERAGGDRADLDNLLVGTQAHDRALAEGAFDLRQRRVQSLRFVHRIILYEPQ